MTGSHLKKNIIVITKNITCEYQNEIGKFISVERLEPLKNVVAVTRRMLVNHETM